MGQPSRFGIGTASFGKAQQHGHSRVRGIQCLSQQCRVADVVMHHAVAQRPGCDPLLAVGGQDTQPRGAVEVVQGATQRLADQRQQRRQELVAAL